MLRSLTIILFTVVVATATLATPPRVSNVREELIASTSDHIYSLRRIWSNSGMHTVSSEDLFLVEIDVHSGAMTAYWPLRSSISTSEDGVNWDVRETERFEEYGNFYDILRTKQAVPTSISGPYDGGGYKFKNGDLITNFNDPTGASGAKTLIRGDTLQDLLRVSHQQIFDLYPPLDFSMETDMSGEYIAPPSIEAMTGCEIIQKARGRGEVNGVEIVPILLNCNYENHMDDGIDLWVFVPDWRDL